MNFNNKCVKTAKTLGRAYLKQINRSDVKNKQELISKAFEEAAKLSITKEQCIWEK